MIEPKQYISRGTAQKRTGLSKNAFLKLLEDGTITFARKESGGCLIDVDSVRKFIERRNQNNSEALSLLVQKLKDRINYLEGLLAQNGIEVPSESNETKTGILQNTGLNYGQYYRHFRNRKLYRLVAFATIEATGEEAIVYQAMYGERRLWIRTKENFFQEVEHEGRMVPRFESIPEALALKELEKE